MFPLRRTARLLPLAVASVLFFLPSGTVRAEEDCLSCHGSVDNVGDDRLVVSATAWQATVHASNGIACVDCHAGHDQYPHQASAPRAACANCHQDAIEALAASVHKGGGELVPPRPECESCHGTVHSMLPTADLASKVNPLNLPTTCGACHSNPGLSGDVDVRFVQPIAAYSRSVHARAVAKGEKAATCSSCHGSHDILPGSDPRSSVAKRNVPATCGKCHPEIAATFAESVHGKAAALGIQEAPVCTDCHGEHRILGPGDKGSPVFATNIPKVTCGRCHGDVRLTEKFGMKTNAVTAFEDSFHGLAGRTGRTSVANCASCHGVHDILPSSDPRSHVNPANLGKTCGACHPGAGTRFAIGPVHVLPQQQSSGPSVVYWVRYTYLWLIWLVIGGMVVHNLLDLKRKGGARVAVPVVPVERRRLRMSRGFRIAHAATFSSFFVLVWSGFALKFPSGWWARPLLLWEQRFAFRGWLHRGAAVVLLAAFAFHFLHLAIDRRARACMLGMLPNRHDLDELRHKLLWLVGLRADPPHAPALGYAEKAEYLALLWGTFVMALSGFVLWFENWSLASLPKWATDVATVVHFYEAILASLAILVWHFYFVIFDPLVYPMDTAWLTGREAPGRTLERSASLLPSADEKDGAES
jgi:cytochrome b subunit of formate dehydrogenase